PRLPDVPTIPRPEYDRRMALWRKIILAWESSEHRADEGEKVIEWLTTSLDRMRYDTAAVLPPAPTFGTPLPVPEALANVPVESSLPTPRPESMLPHRTAVPPEPAPNSLAVNAAVPEPPTPLPPGVGPRVLEHRVDKPVVPSTASPPREIARQVNPV